MCILRLIWNWSQNFTAPEVCRSTQSGQRVETKVRKLASLLLGRAGHLMSVASVASIAAGWASFGSSRWVLWCWAAFIGRLFCWPCCWRRWRFQRRHCNASDASDASPHWTTSQSLSIHFIPLFNLVHLVQLSAHDGMFGNLRWIRFLWLLMCRAFTFLIIFVYLSDIWYSIFACQSSWFCGAQFDICRRLWHVIFLEPVSVRVLPRNIGSNSSQATWCWCKVTYFA